MGIDFLIIPSPRPPNNGITNTLTITIYNDHLYLRTDLDISHNYSFPAHIWFDHVLTKHHIGIHMPHGNMSKKPNRKISKFMHGAK